MPIASRTTSLSHPHESEDLDSRFRGNDRGRMSIVTCQMSHVRKSPGFTMVEILLFLLVVLALTTILLSSAGVLSKTRGGNLESIATGIAHCEVERLRNLDYTSITLLPASENITSPNPCSSDLSKLPSGSATRTAADYGSPPDPDIRQITITVTWTENTVNKDIKMSTLISRYGL